ncbi:MAG: M20 family metallopeptidase [Halarsenatibacteraceae bacterium]
MILEKEELINQLLDDYSEESTINLLKEMIKIPSHKNVEWQEDKQVKFIADYLADHQVENINLEYIEENRPNIIARISGNNTGSNLLLNGHTDTIPPYNMVIPPYTPEVKDGYITGRGSVDMKGSLAAMLSAMVIIAESNIDLSGDLIFAGVIDQEQRSLGAVKLVEDKIDADYSIVGEPTDLRICHAHKGMEWYKIVIKGLSAHGSTPEKGQNTIYHGARIAAEIEKLNFKLMARENSFVSPPTINVGVISGGDDPNIVPNITILEVDRRYTPDESRQNIYEEIERLLAKVNSTYPGFITEVITMEDRVCPLKNMPLTGINENKLTGSLQNSLKRFSDRDNSLTYFRGWSDAALFANKLMIPSLVFGPGLSEKCHSGDESLKIKDLIAAVKIYLNVILDICY